MKPNMLAGTLIGFSVVFLAKGFLTAEFDWVWWLSMLIGGTIGHLIIAFLVKNKTGKNSKKE